MTEQQNDPAHVPPAELLLEVAELRSYLLELGSHPPAAHLDPSYHKSARNLMQYLALRQIDMRLMQEHLLRLGLSSLGRAEPHVMASVDAVFQSLQHIAQNCGRDATYSAAFVGVAEGRALLGAHTAALLGNKPERRGVRIMVTLSSEAAHEPAMLDELLAAGTDCIRINCAHDDATAWKAMIAYLRTAEQKQNRRCKILMDLGGPKVRTGPVAGIPVVKASVEHDAFGRVLHPLKIWFVANGSAENSRTKGIRLPVPQEWLLEVQTGDMILMQDTRHRERKMNVFETGEGYCRAECSNSFYATTGSKLTLKRPVSRGGSLSAEIGVLTEIEQPLLLNRGDIVKVTRSLEPGASKTLGKNDEVLSEAYIGCTLPEIFSRVKPGERIWFDDGKIGGVIRETNIDFLRAEITVAAPSGAKLRSDKGINLPDSNLSLSALTAEDLKDLEFVARNADMIGFSFVQNPADVLDLHERVKAITDRPVGVVLKIETQRAFQKLPDLLLASMHRPLAGVMIARGDLAIECGFERMAEVQEEILWICEAAHIPVIWATQVLESVAKSGQPSRAEITDAAMGVRAECVMLNKGPYILEAVRILDDILSRMQEHHSKKRSMLRRLTSWPIDAS